MWIVFIVSCIPTIRPLFAKFFNKVYSSGSRTFGTGRGYEQQNDASGAGTHSRAYASHAGSHKGADSKVVSLPTRNDNESEESILPGQQGIMMTNQVVVKYEGADGERDKGERDWKNHFDDSVEAFRE
jgi:hypothetical protein